MLLSEAFNNYLDELARTEIRVLCRSRPAFQVCGFTGLALAVILALSLVTHSCLSPWVMTEIVLTAILTFIALVIITKIITGNGREIISEVLSATSAVTFHPLSLTKRLIQNSTLKVGRAKWNATVSRVVAD
jgi:hypothetical protein